MPIDKRFQVFVSSTFSDLQEERQEIMQALLELNCIPAGMELFPAANEDQWSLIKRVIDDSDYYIIVIAGRYGSLGPDMVSYTEMEYRYALGKGKPIIGFIHKDPGSLPANRCEADLSKKEKLEKFKEFVQKKLVRHWKSPTDLGSVVSRSLINLMRESPAIGWVKSNAVPDEGSAQEILRFNRLIEELRSGSRVEIDGEVPSLACGGDEFSISMKISMNHHLRAEIIRLEWISVMSWDSIFSVISPAFANGESAEKTMEKLSSHIYKLEENEIITSISEFENYSFSSITLSDESSDTIIIQFAALGLIERDTRNNFRGGAISYWRITQKGESLMYRLRAIRKPNHVAVSARRNSA